MTPDGSESRKGRKRAAGPDDPAAFKREAGGSYRSVDGRFTIEAASGRWLVLDAEQHDDLGLSLVRGPFDTLAEAKAAAGDARSAPAPASDLATRHAGLPARPARATKPLTVRGNRAGGTPVVPARAAALEPPPIEIRRYGRGDGPAMRVLWTEIGLESLGDDDDGLDLLAARNPGLVLLATEGERVVGTALGAWDGRRGWIYHLGVAPDRRRAGLGRRLVHELERKLRAIGCQKVDVIVRDENPDGAAFWTAIGYASPPARPFGKVL